MKVCRIESASRSGVVRYFQSVCGVCGRVALRGKKETRMEMTRRNVWGVMTDSWIAEGQKKSGLAEGKGEIWEGSITALTASAEEVEGSKRFVAYGGVFGFGIVKEEGKVVVADDALDYDPGGTEGCLGF